MTYILVRQKLTNPVSVTFSLCLMSEDSLSTLIPPPLPYLPIDTCTSPRLLYMCTDRVLIPLAVMSYRSPD